MNWLTPLTHASKNTVSRRDFTVTNWWAVQFISLFFTTALLNSQLICCVSFKVLLFIAQLSLFYRMRESYLKNYFCCVGCVMLGSNRGDKQLLEENLSSFINWYFYRHTSGMAVSGNSKTASGINIFEALTNKLCHLSRGTGIKLQVCEKALELTVLRKKVV